MKTIPPVNSTNPHQQLLGLLWQFKGLLCAGLLLMLVTVATQLSFPHLLAVFIDKLNQPEPGWLSQLLPLMALLALLQAVAGSWRFYLFQLVGYGLVARVRQDLLRILLGQPMAFFDQHHAAALTSRLSADAEQLHDNLVMGLTMSLRSALVFIGAFFMLLSISWQLSLVLVVFIPLYLWQGSWLGSRLSKTSEQIQQQQAHCNQQAQEYFSQVRLLRGFDQQAYAQRRYNQATATWFDSARQCARQVGWYQGLSVMLMLGSLLLTIWVGSGLITSGQLSIGALSGFVIYAGMLTGASSAMSDLWSEWMRTVGATREIMQYLAIDKQPAAAPGQPHQLKGAVRFEQVDFSYPSRSDQPALQQVSFAVSAGMKVAIVGASGAGKSTITNLLLGFYTPDGGQILFDGVSQATLDLPQLRRQIALVEQEPSLLSGSIFDNIAFGVADRTVSQAEVEAAAKLAQAHAFITQFAAGYQTEVGEQGLQLSGGQRQRIAIARALLKDPAILILDEATSALDADNEALLQQALQPLLQNRTTFIIAHRLSTVRDADLVLVLQHGKLIELGQPAQLLNNPRSAFWQLMHHQLGFTTIAVAG